jgi:hypothetical protein
VSPERARLVVPADAVLSAECRTNYFGGAWVIIARLPGYERAMTIFGAADPFGAARWLADYDRLCAL